MIFERDIFSNKFPKWEKINNKDINLFKDLCSHIPQLIFFNIKNIYYSGAFEINSTNFKLESKYGNSILLKKWPSHTNLKYVDKNQSLVNWLFHKKIPVPYPGTFKNKRYSLDHNNAIWSFNSFVDGNYFSGQDNELISSANITAKLANALLETPSDLVPELGPLYPSKDDKFVIEQMIKERANWINYFGKETTKTLNLYWDFIYDNWINLISIDHIKGPVVPCHFDMHPHNLIAKNGQINAVLDFDSCKRIPLGISLAFNALKQCRQTISNDNDIYEFKKIADTYIEIISNQISCKDFSSYDFLNLSKLEVMRRVCLIFRLNLRDNNSKWNHILPVQIAHLFESDKLFK